MMMKKKLLVLLTVTLAATACSRAPQPQWGQGYDSPQGQYMEPDHSYFYYWMMYHSTLGLYQPQPVYHVYVAPAGYPREYRPWQSREYVRDSGGRFVRKPPPPPAPRSQTTGGYSQSKPTAATPSRSTGGYAQAPAPPVKASSQTSGGYTAKPPSTPPPPKSSQATGGYSSKPSQPSSRATGGYSTTKKKK